MAVTVVVATIPTRKAVLIRALLSVDAQTLAPAWVIVELDNAREGAAAVRNRALAKVDTELVAFLDDDDVLYPDHLRRLTRYLRRTGVDVAYPGSEPDTTGRFGYPFDPGLIRQRNIIPVTALARTEKVKAAGGFQPHPDINGDPCEDWGLWLAMLDHGCTFGHLPVKTWRCNPGGTRGRPDRW